MEVYNKNRDKNKSMRDEIREQNAKLKDAPLKEKLSYFNEYYLKITLAVIVIIVFVGYLGYSMITAPSDTALGAFFYNAYGNSSNTELADSFAEYKGIDTSRHDVYIDSTMYLTETLNDADSYMSLEKTMTRVAANELDVIVGDTVAIDYFARSEYLSDITAILPEDLLEKFKDRLYYTKFDENGGSVLPVGVYIDDSVKLKEYYYFNSEPILSFVVNSDNVDNAIDFLRYLYIEE